MIYFLMVLAGAFYAFYSIGHTVVYTEDPHRRFKHYLLLGLTDLMILGLATFFIPSIAGYVFTFAFTKALIYGITNPYLFLYGIVVLEE